MGLLAQSTPVETSAVESITKTAIKALREAALAATCELYNWSIAKAGEVRVTGKL